MLRPEGSTAGQAVRPGTRTTGEPVRVRKAQVATGDRAPTLHKKTGAGLGSGNAARGRAPLGRGLTALTGWMCTHPSGVSAKGCSEGVPERSSAPVRCSPGGGDADRAASSQVGTLAPLHPLHRSGEDPTPGSLVPLNDAGSSQVRRVRFPPGALPAADESH